MKIFYVCLLAIIIPSICRAEDMKVNRFDDLKFSINCPSKYEVKKMEGAYENTVGILLSKDVENKSFKPNVTISSAQNSNPPIDLDRFFSLNLQNFLKDANFKLDLAEKTRLGDRDVYQLMYKQKAALKDGSNAVVDIRVLQIYLIDPSRVYVMNYSAAQDDFDKYLTTANEIFASLRTL